VPPNSLFVPSGLGHNLLFGNNLAPLPRPIFGEMVLRIWDVEHGACAMLHYLQNGVPGRLAMIDSGDTVDWSPSSYIRYELNRTTLDYLFITNADQDHMSDLTRFMGSRHQCPCVASEPNPRSKDIPTNQGAERASYPRCRSVFAESRHHDDCGHSTVRPIHGRHHVALILEFLPAVYDDKQPQSGRLHQIRRIQNSLPG
jgi:hypothetical protein